MSHNIHDLIERRKRWIAINKENGFDEGIKNLLTDLYPDSAHFVFELLQNAEDAKASMVKFKLYNNRVEFEHNGSHLFTIDDVDAITSIGTSNKKDDPTNIGKFGVGFKSVYSYTLTPEVISGDFHFRIHDLVVPDIDGLDPINLSRELTRFIIPFNNPNKPPENAVAEIQALLKSLNQSTLLFLSSISKIEYILPNGTSGYIEREEFGNHLVDIIALMPDDSESRIVSYFRLRKGVEIIDEKGNTMLRRISIAYRISQDSTHEKNHDGIRMKLEKIEPGRVSIYFPAEKETSNLKFHIDAPFASTVARDSVRDCEENNKLRDQIADLVEESLFVLREQHLLTVDFLSVLPNIKDEIPPFYQPIMDRIVDAFKNEDLTPMKKGGYAPASDIFRGPARLLSLLSDDDLVTLLNDDYIAPMWVANAPLRNSRSDDFLSMLEISEYKIDDFTEILSEMPDYVENWISGKSNEWHQQLYAMLSEHISLTPDYLVDERIETLSELRIVRLTDGSYGLGKNSFFPDESNNHDKLMPRVNKDVFSYGKNKRQQDKAKQLLEKIGVRKVGESEQIEMLLKMNYSKDAVANKRFSPKLTDIKRFMRFLDKEPTRAYMFKDMYIFKCETGKWGLAEEIYLDAPYLDTGLSAYYDRISEEARCWKLSEEYQGLKLSLKTIGEFAKKIGAKSSLDITQTRNWHYINYTIEYLSLQFDQISLPVSKLIWDALVKCEQSQNYSYYTSEKKKRVYFYPYGNSEFITLLSDHQWVPQKLSDEESFTFVKPEDADSKLLPDGFTFDNGWKWLSKTSFGEMVKRKELLKHQEDMEHELKIQQRESMIKDVGFDSLAEARKVAQAKKNDPQGYERWLARANKPEFPKKISPDPIRREERVKEKMVDAEHKTYDQKSRSVRTTTSPLDVETYLRSSYENEDGLLVCQICKDVMPFKKRDNEYYMEKVEIFTKEYLSKEHDSHYLALCPLCSAKYKEFVKAEQSQLDNIYNSLLQQSECHEIPITLDEEATIKFVETHYCDLRGSIHGDTE